MGPAGGLGRRVLLPAKRRHQSPPTFRLWTFGWGSRPPRSRLAHHTCDERHGLSCGGRFGGGIHRKPHSKPAARFLLSGPPAQGGDVGGPGPPGAAPSAVPRSSRSVPRLPRSPRLCSSRPAQGGGDTSGSGTSPPTHTFWRSPGGAGPGGGAGAAAQPCEGPGGLARGRCRGAM